MPWARVVEKSGGTTGTSWHNHDDDLGAGMTQVKHGGGVGNAKDADGKPYEVRTLGWQPQCSCGGDPVPCLVLDPFMGSGTVGLVARKLGRNYVGCELNSEYAAMAEKRIKGYAPLFQEHP